MIAVQNISKVYQSGRDVRVDALKGVSLEVQPGDFTVIAGPSGSGKSTLLHLIGALDTPTQGEILFEAKSLSGLSADQLTDFRRKNIGFIFQAYNLLPTLTALENVEYALLLKNLPADQRAQQALDVLTRVGLDKQARRFPNELSGGQQQRVAVARAIVSQPKVVLADEPTANLDSKTAEHLIDLMKMLNQEKGVTFIFSTHDSRIMNKAKKLVILQDGEILKSNHTN